MAQFLADQGYDVRLHIDDPDAAAEVRIADIKQDVREFVDRNNLHQLLIYFSGHGVRMAHRGEMWLLSGAQDDSAEAINLVSSSEVCRYCRVPNIVFISDACRSTPESMRFEIVDGTNIFPSRDGDGAIDIDKFFAALPGNPSFEVGLGTSVRNYRSLYTDAFLAAYLDPPPDRVAHLDGLEVVPNRMLHSFLVDETQRLADLYGVIRNVEPDSEVPSEDDVYIGQAWRRAGSGPDLPAWVQHIQTTAPTDAATATANTVDGYARALIDKGVALTSTPPNVSDESLAAQTSAILSRLQPEAHLPEADLSFGGAPAGVAAYGMPLDQVVTYPGMAQHRLDGLGPERVRSHAALDLERPGASALAIFGDGLSVVVPVFRGYVTHIFRGERGVGTVSFEPVPENRFLGEEERVHLAELRALVTQATIDGAFRFSGRQDDRSNLAAAFADKIRQFKAIDPTLGILAAYAYSYAFLPDQVASIREYMLGDLQVPVFDLDLMNRRSQGDHDGRAHLEGAVPFCPAVRAGWELLEVKGVGLPEPVRAARPYLRDALWSSFDPSGTEILRTAIAEGLL